MQISKKVLKKTVDKCFSKDYCIVNSTNKCEEQEMTSPYHRLQKAVNCENRQQGMGGPSPASCFYERRIIPWETARLLPAVKGMLDVSCPVVKAGIHR